MEFWLLQISSHRDNYCERLCVSPLYWTSTSLVVPAFGQSSLRSRWHRLHRSIHAQAQSARGRSRHSSRGLNELQLVGNKLGIAIFPAPSVTCSPGLILATQILMRIAPPTENETSLLALANIVAALTKLAIARF